MVRQEDAQWWAGAVGAGLFFVVGATVVPHPYDKLLMSAMAFCQGFSLYRVNSGASGRGRPDPALVRASDALDAAVSVGVRDLRVSGEPHADSAVVGAPSTSPAQRAVVD